LVRIAPHTAGRADMVLCRKVRKGFAQVLEVPLVSHGDPDPGRTSFADAHEPQGATPRKAIRPNSCSGTVTKFTALSYFRLIATSRTRALISQRTGLRPWFHSLASHLRMTDGVIPVNSPD
jgi:hypothetical protein